MICANYTISISNHHKTTNAQLFATKTHILHCILSIGIANGFGDCPKNYVSFVDLPKSFWNWTHREMKMFTIHNVLLELQHTDTQ